MEALKEITPEQVPIWIPGATTLDSSGLDWRQITLKGYQYQKQYVQIPSMRDYMIVSYKDCDALMRRKNDGRWEVGNVSAGKISILTRAQSSEWEWGSDIKVSHLYLNHDSLARVAQEIFDKDVVGISIPDVLQAEDPIIHCITNVLEAELGSKGQGGALYVDMVRNQLCIHILRKYAQINFREYQSYGVFSNVQLRMLNEFLDENISENVSLEQMADFLGMSVYALIRRFQATLGSSPHAYLMGKRITKAKHLLKSTNIPLKIVAAHCGFADQSHMTRTFRKELNVTPANFRRDQL